MRKEYPPLKTARELEWGFKIRYTVFVLLVVCPIFNMPFGLVAEGHVVHMPKVCCHKQCKPFVFCAETKPGQILLLRLRT